MLKNIIFLFLVFKVLFTLSDSLLAHPKGQVSKSVLECKMYIVDTITIKSPLVIKITDSMDKSQYLLVEKENLMITDTLLNVGSYQYILKCENIFCPTYKFTCLVNNYVSSEGERVQSKYTTIKELLKKSKAEVWSDYIEITRTKKYSIYSLNIQSFLVVLVRNDFLNQCQSRDEVKNNDNCNLYRKVLVPITW